jgi:hypothetical protein
MDFVVWYPEVVDTPGVAGTDHAGSVRTAIASLRLHPPTVGVGAYVYRGYEQWGLTWWVGAPMWLWVDRADTLQWGSHTVSATEGSVSITATLSATQVSYDTGDGSPLVVCRSPGTSRAWDPDAYMDEHSPSRCEHAYLHTNTLGDVDSRYVVSATVLWKVSWWASDGQSGSFVMEVASTESVSVHVGELRVVRVPDPTPR